MPDTIGRAWCEGRDPEDGGWSFDETNATINGYDMAYGTHSRQEAIALGVPASVCDRFEAAGHQYGNSGYDLFAWLCDHNDWFRN